MKKRKIIKITLISLSVFFVLFAVLIVHIAMVTKYKAVEPDGRQLSRIDFTEKVDSTEANKIKSFVGHLDGVESTYFNIPDGIFVYTYSLNKQNSLGVYNKLMSYGKYKAHRYVVDAADATKGCPAMGGNKSFILSLAMYVGKLIN
jgi:hypothetical protein